MNCSQNKMLSRNDNFHIVLHLFLSANAEHQADPPPKSHQILLPVIEDIFLFWETNKHGQSGILDYINLYLIRNFTERCVQIMSWRSGRHSAEMVHGDNIARSCCKTYLTCVWLKISWFQDGKLSNSCAVSHVKQWFVRSFWLLELELLPALPIIWYSYAHRATQSIQCGLMCRFKTSHIFK